jgi:chromosome segregation ATPase
MTQDSPSRLDRIEAALAIHNEILTTLAPLTAQVTQLLARTHERVEQHDLRLDRIEANLDRLEEQTTRNAESLDRLEQRMNQLSELVTTSTTETIQLVAQQAVQAERDRASWQEDRQTWQAEIRRIWEHLERQTGNGNGRGEQ